LNGQAFAAIALHCPVALLPGRCEVFTMYRSAFLATALLSIAHAAKAESGLASYYGGRGHGSEMTCAHRTRALGSIVTVTRAGHSVQCRVNDRGPFVRGRVIDVSMSAARALGMMRAGVVRVSVQ
jgi:rare lipoprotein A